MSIVPPQAPLGAPPQNPLANNAALTAQQMQAGLLDPSSFIANPTDADRLNPEVTFVGAEAFPNRREFPLSYSKNRPTYDDEKPELVLDYIKQCEDVIIACGVTTDRVRKQILVYFLGTQQRGYWKTMSKYTTGTYDEFKQEVIRYHPAAFAQEHGGVTQLRKICLSFQGVSLESSSDVLRFGLYFKAEAAKLGPNAISNRELSELYLATLEEGFRNEVMRKASQDFTASNVMDIVIGPSSIPCSTYIQIAEQMSQARERFGEGFVFGKQSQGGVLRVPGLALSDPFSNPLSTQALPKPASVHPSWTGATSSSTVKLEENVAQLAELFKGFANQIKGELKEQKEIVHRGLDDMMAVKDKMEILQRNPHNFTVAPPRFARPPGTYTTPYVPNQSYSRPPMTGCGYCSDQGHLIGGCPHKLQALKEGLIVATGDQIYLKGSSRPLYSTRFENMKSYVEKMTSPAAKAQNMIYHDEMAYQQQFMMNAAPEDQLRYELETLRGNFNQLREELSSSRPPLPPQSQQFVQSETETALQKLQREQIRNNRLLEKFLQQHETEDDRLYNPNEREEQDFHRRQ